jgi:hypothetical protein
VHYDGDNHLSVALIGDTGHAIVGGESLAGQVRMKNANTCSPCDRLPYQNEV